MLFNFERIFLQTDTLVIDSFQPLNVLKSWTERVVKLGSVHLRIHFSGFLVRINLKTLPFEWSWRHTNSFITQNSGSKFWVMAVADHDDRIFFTLVMQIPQWNFKNHT